VIDIRSRIKLIENLLKMETIQGATYAALECRSTIEAMCYERFAISNSHLSPADLKKWQPRDVVRQVLEEANAQAAGPLVLMMSRPLEPHEVGKVDLTNLDYVEIGRQSELRYVALAKLHHALSNVALHIKIPSPGSEVEIYGNQADIEAKVRETLCELAAAVSGSMLISGLGEECKFTCLCGSTIKRKSAMLQPGQTVCCNRLDCKESYTVSYEGADIFFTRRAHSLDCVCGNPIDVPERLFRELRLGDQLTAKCGSCNAETLFKWNLLAAQRVPITTPSGDV
jgi:hypothetical protein